MTPKAQFILVGSLAVKVGPGWRFSNVGFEVLAPVHGIGPDLKAGG